MEMQKDFVSGFGGRGGGGAGKSGVGGSETTKDVSVWRYTFLLQFVAANSGKGLQQP